MDLKKEINAFLKTEIGQKIMNISNRGLITFDEALRWMYEAHHEEEIKKFEE